MIFRPNKTDLYQIESLSKLGVSKPDIASILGISESKLSDWEKKSAKVSAALKPKARPEYTLNHHEFIDKVEEAFACGGKRYYRFKDEFRMSTGRYSYYYATLQEFGLNVSREKLIDFIEAFTVILDGGKGSKPEIKYTKLVELLINLKTRLHKLAFEPQLAKDLASIAFFDDSEDLTTYDSEYGKKKIALWEEHKVHDFFFEKPIGELLNVNSSSLPVLQDYLTTQEQVLKDLNSGLQTALEGKS